MGITAWWNKIRAEFKDATGNETAMQTIRSRVERAAEDRRIHCRKYPTGSEERITNDWSIALDEWIKVLDLHLDNDQEKKDAAEALETKRKARNKAKESLKHRFKKKTHGDSSEDPSTEKEQQKETEETSRSDSPPIFDSPPRPNDAALVFTGTPPASAPAKRRRLLQNESSSRASSASRSHSTRPDREEETDEIVAVARDMLDVQKEKLVFARAESSRNQRANQGFETRIQSIEQMVRASKDEAEEDRKQAAEDRRRAEEQQKKIS